MGGLAGAAPGGFLVGIGGEATGISKEFPVHLRMGYGLGEAAWGLAQMVGGLMGEVGGGALSVAGAGASATGAGAVVGVPAIAGGVVVIGVSTAAIAEGGADLLTGLGVFASAWNDYKRNPPASSQGASPSNTPTGHSPNSSQPGGASGGGKPKVEGAGPEGVGGPAKIKTGDKTPGGRSFSEHAAERANERNFTPDSIDAIINNNKKTRKSKVDEFGQKTWEYVDARGNKVVTNESGGIVSVHSPARGGKYIPKNQ